MPRYCEMVDVKMADGSVARVRVQRSGKRESCDTTGCPGWSQALCDFPLAGHGGEKTCSRKMCGVHKRRQPALDPTFPQRRQGDDVDYCEVHDRFARALEAFAGRRYP